MMWSIHLISKDYDRLYISIATPRDPVDGYRRMAQGWTTHEAILNDKRAVSHMIRAMFDQIRNQPEIEFISESAVARLLESVDNLIDLEVDKAKWPLRFRIPPTTIDFNDEQSISYGQKYPVTERRGNHPDDGNGKYRASGATPSH